MHHHFPSPARYGPEPSALGPTGIPRTSRRRELRQALRKLKQAVGAQGLSAAASRLGVLNTVRKRHPPCHRSSGLSWWKPFRDEVALLLNRDLNHWV